MRGNISVAVALCGYAFATPAQAQIINDAIAATIAAANAGVPKGCLSLEWKLSPKALERFKAEAEPALRAYLDIAKVGGDPTSVYKGYRPWWRWQLDGEKNSDFSSIRDPWVSRINRLEQVDLTLGAIGNFGRGVWRAYDADGTLLGTYYVRLARKTKGHGVNWVDLWSPGQEDKAPPLTPFCLAPGDHEEYVAAKEKKERERAERRAARTRD